MIVLYIFICAAIFYFKHMGLKMICQGMWFVRACVICFAERGVIDSQSHGDFLFASVFLLELLFTQQKNQPHSRCSIM